MAGHCTCHFIVLVLGKQAYKATKKLPVIKSFMSPWTAELEAAEPIADVENGSMFTQCQLNKKENVDIAIQLDLL
jgi:hypothetical protein